MFLHKLNSEVLQNIKINHVINRQESLISGGLLQCGESGSMGGEGVSDEMRMMREGSEETHQGEKGGPLPLSCKINSFAFSP